MSACDNCGAPVGEVGLPGDLHVIYIKWDDTHTSPPIGPFVGYAESQKVATRIRKALRRNGKPWQNRVSTVSVRPPEVAMSWYVLREES